MVSVRFREVVHCERAVRASTIAPLLPPRAHRKRDPLTRSDPMGCPLARGRGSSAGARSTAEPLRDRADAHSGPAMLSPKCWRGRKITNSVGFLGAIPMGQMRVAVLDVVFRLGARLTLCWPSWRPRLAPGLTLGRPLRRRQLADRWKTGSRRWWHQSPMSRRSRLGTPCAAASSAAAGDGLPDWRREAPPSRGAAGFFRRSRCLSPSGGAVASFGSEESHR